MTDGITENMNQFYNTHVKSIKCRIALYEMPIIKRFDVFMSTNTFIVLIVLKTFIVNKFQL